MASTAHKGSKWQHAKNMVKAIAHDRGECVHVVVRVRPMNSKEIADKRACAVHVDEERHEIRVTDTESGENEHVKQFTFDTTYGPNSTQRQVYDITASPIVESVMQGFNGTIFAYGQTGAGKSFTMEGVRGQPELAGIIPNSFHHIFGAIGLEKDKDKQFLVRASYLEIYNEEVRDLLSHKPKTKLDLREDAERGVFIPGLTSRVVKSIDEIDDIRQHGERNRSVGATKMNQVSSRSHSIFTITVETSEKGKDGEAHIRVGKLNMVDLAGSERQSKTGATGDRFTEAKSINLSLTALGNVISSLVDSKTHHIPYRDSKLTRLLQDSLGGNTKTVMIANCGPAGYNYKETLSTLRYANRAKNIKNKPKINEDPKDAMLREFQEEIERLRKQLQDGGAVGPDGKVVEKQVIVEKVVVKKEGVSKEEVEKLRRDAAEEKERLRAAAEAERVKAQQAQEAAEAERQRLQADLEKQMATVTEQTEREKAKIQAELAALAEAERQRADKITKQSEEEKKALAAKLEAKVQALIAKGEAEKKRLAEEMEAQAQAKEKARLEAEAAAKRLEEQAAEQRAAMESKLTQMQQQLMIGGANLDKAAKEKAEMWRKQVALQQELEEQKRLEAANQREMEEANLMIEEKYNSLQEEADGHKRKLKKVWGKLKSARQEIQDLTEEFQAEREDLLDTVRKLRQDLALKHEVIESFIPPVMVSRIERNAEWNDKTQAWLIKQVKYAGNKIKAQSRPAKGSGKSKKKEGRARSRAGKHAGPVMDMAVLPRRTRSSLKDVDEDAFVADLLDPGLGSGDELAFTTPSAQEPSITVVNEQIRADGSTVVVSNGWADDDDALGSGKSDWPQPRPPPPKSASSRSSRHHRARRSRNGRTPEASAGPETAVEGDGSGRSGGSGSSGASQARHSSVIRLSNATDDAGAGSGSGSGGSGRSASGNGRKSSRHSSRSRSRPPVAPKSRSKSKSGRRRHKHKSRKKRGGHGETAGSGHSGGGGRGDDDDDDDDGDASDEDYSDDDDFEEDAFVPSGAQTDRAPSSQRKPVYPSARGLVGSV